MKTKKSRTPPFLSRARLPIAGVAVILLLGIGGTYFQLTSSVVSNRNSRQVKGLSSKVVAKTSSLKSIKPTTKSTPKSTPPAAAPAPSVPASSAGHASSGAKAGQASSKVTVGNNSEPVVTSSPSSSVNTLTPTAPSSSGGSGSGSSSPLATTTSYTSTNWSGYLATDSSYSAISGAWNVPSVSGNGVSTSADGTWIGIGGVTSGDLIQIGTQDTVSAGGVVTTSAFYETLPAVSQTVPGLNVSAGDSMSASITEISSGTWTITITDNTTNQNFSDTVAYTSTNSSAEWIEEDPSFSNLHQIPFDNFSSVSFSGASATSSSGIVNLNSGDAQPVTMVSNSDQPIATPSAITGSGASFSITHD